MNESGPRRHFGGVHFDGVDILRGFSILAVVLLHTSIRMQGAGFSMKQSMPPLLFHFLFRNGNNGVTVFFAVSGFLITITSLRRFGSLRNLHPGKFYRIRFARIAPLLLLILAALSALHLAHANGFVIAPQKASLPRALLAALTFHLNWLEADRGWLPANWDVLWSLSVEEMFYLFFPLLCMLLLQWRRGFAAFLAILLVFAAMGPFARVVWTTNPIWQEKTYLGGMDAIALGCLTALLADHLAKRGKLRLPWIALGIAGAAMMLLVLVWPPWSMMRAIGNSGTDGSILAAGTCLVILATAMRAFRGGRASAGIRWVGRHSYEIYLTHEFLIIWGTLLYVRFRTGPLWLWYVAILLLSALLGAAAARWFSEPLNRRLRAGSVTEKHATIA